MPDLYETLGLPKNATKAQIRRARKQKAQKLHPDRNKDPKAAQEMTAVNAAADVLENDEKRARYDRGEGTAPVEGPQQRA
jgi:curved DNA-binding protein CbpA